MPVAEDIPSMIPIAIIICVIILAMATIYMNYLQKTEANTLHRIGLNILEQKVYPKHGVIGEAELTPAFLSRPSLGLEITLTAKDLAAGKEFGIKDPKAAVVVSLPFLIRYDNGTVNDARMYAGVKRK